MIRVDRQALVCDLAETYHIYNYRSLPMRTVATLAAGLREDSRIMMRLSNRTVSFNTMLLAEVADRLAILINGKEPESRLVEQFLIKESKPDDVMQFDSVEDFIAARNKRLRGN